MGLENGTVEDVVETIFKFGFVDYTVFGVMLLVSAGIGVYFGFFANSENTTEEYLLGGKRMKTIPIAISLIASQLSGIAIMTIPSEIYSYGATYYFMVLSVIFVYPILCWIVVPVFYNNNISNCYEYLELRFDKRTRQLITMAFTLNVYLFIPVYIFIPALAFSQVTGMNIHLINGVVCSICIFYTMLGGIKAVVWTDVIQGSIMVASVLVIAIFGIIKLGGINAVLSKAYEGGRLDLVTNLDFTTRATVWNTFLGGLLLWIGHAGLNQSCVQRIVALPSLKHAQRALLIFTTGLLLVLGFCCFTGIIMFGTYDDCDPVKAGLVAKPDKMMPYFVQDIVGHISGMPGFFISCVFSAALSTMSANLNSLAGVVYFDYIKPHINHTEQKANFIMKILVVVTGAYCILAGWVVEQFTSILQMVITIAGVTFGSVFGAFMMGFLIPKINSRGAFWAIVVSMTTMSVIIISGQIQLKYGNLKYDLLPSSIEGCENRNMTISDSAWAKIDAATVEPTPAIDPFDITKLSFHWYSVAGGLITTFVALFLSCILPETKGKKLDPKLFAPMIARKMKTEDYTEVSLKEKYDI
ncbi:hypothetical protein ACFFRR_011013 [Megaselia abdita]